MQELYGHYAGNNRSFHDFVQKEKELEINKCYNENCLDTMAMMPDGFIDLTVTSPPYDNLRTYNGYSFDFEGTLFLQAWQVLKQIRDYRVILSVFSVIASVKLGQF